MKKFNYKVMTKRFSQKTLNLLEKAKESALLAVDVYNKPKTSFRTGGFVVLMCIAWTSLLHAIFEKNKIKYFYKKRNGRYERIDGDKKSWELLKSAKEFYKNEERPEYKNILLFSQIRNKIEHRFMPAIDPLLSGECQALLLNFEELLVKEFGKKHSIIENLFIPLQLTKQKKALPKNKNDKEVIKFIKKFRSALSVDVVNSQSFSFKAFFIPKLGNHRNSSDIAIEFVKFDPSNKVEMEKYQKMIVGIKEKIVPVANQGKYKPGDLYKKIKEEFGENNR